MEERVEKLCSACCQNDLATVTRLLQKYPKLVHKYTSPKKTVSKGTCIHAASHNGHLQIVKFLLDKGADVNCSTYQVRRTPLHVSANNGHTHVVQYLLEHGANVNAKDDCGYTPLLLGAGNGDLAVVKCLVEHGADMNDVTRPWGKSALIACALQDHPEVAKYLLEQGADVEGGKEEYGYSALHVGAYYGNLEVVKNLVAHGADVLQWCAEGTTPLHTSVTHETVEVLDYLLDFCITPAEVNTPNNEGLSALDLASQSNFEYRYRCRKVLEAKLANGPGQPWSLKHLSRRAIRQALLKLPRSDAIRWVEESNFSKLELPQALIDYLKYK